MSSSLRDRLVIANVTPSIEMTPMTGEVESSSALAGGGEYIERTASLCGVPPRTMRSLI